MEGLVGCETLIDKESLGAHFSFTLFHNIVPRQVSKSFYFTKKKKNSKMYYDNPNSGVGSYFRVLSSIYSTKNTSFPTCSMARSRRFFFSFSYPIFFRSLEPPICLFFNMFSGDKTCFFFGLVIFLCPNHFFIFCKTQLRVSQIYIIIIDKEKNVCERDVPK